MNKEEIKRLLEKYYNAETSEEEELTVSRFFSQEQIPDEFSKEKEIFLYYHQLSEIPDPSEGFEQRILAAAGLDDYKISKSVNRGILLSLTGIAAGLFILIGSNFFLIRKSEPHDTFTDPEIAYAETLKILYDVSVRLNSGTQALEPVSRLQEVTVKSLSAIKRPGKIIEDKLKPLDQINKAIEIVGDISDQKERK